jgi:hypothetical protein
VYKKSGGYAVSSGGGVGRGGVQNEGRKGKEKDVPSFLPSFHFLPSPPSFPPRLQYDMFGDNDNKTTLGGGNLGVLGGTGEFEDQGNFADADGYYNTRAGELLGDRYARMYMYVYIYIYNICMCVDICLYIYMSLYIYV